ncbi:hypothetical protein MWN34_12425 [Ancylobacter sp. 6x-1]|uniref:Plasmid mobilization relaxosome protein MobC n=1 Tax=Ancylobacter crimeensis TaxID=2579147 RepID=A0ABT0DCM9_9HYPH|nr:hypothetical protein [Ancylobacter crimeensis]MCK0197718.1 hypothetical protein [Ancylobacter crimeensis]
MRQPRPAPLSIRLTFAERAALVERAAGHPLGAYIKATLFEQPERLRARRSSVHDDQALGQVLALLGRSHLANNLNQLAKAANMGVLPVTPELEDELQVACAEIHEMRALLLKALGIAVQNSPPSLCDAFARAAQ